MVGIIPAIRLLILPLALSLMLAGCDKSPTSSNITLDKSALRPEAGTAAVPLVWLSEPLHASYLTTADFDRDGRTDIALISHAGNLAHIHFQTEKRLWGQGPAIPDVGFHPGELLPLPPEQDQGRFLMFAEGSGNLRIMSLTRQGGLQVEYDLPVFYPRSGTLFRWPDWGLGVAVGPFSKPSIFLFKDFQPRGRAEVQGMELPYTPAMGRVERVIAADIDGDQVEEILFAQPLDSSVKIIRYPGPEAEPKVENLWSFKPGGRARFVVAGDVDQDGDLDLLIPDETEPPGEATRINVLLNLGQAGWRHTPIVFPSRTRAERGKTGIRGFDFALDKDGRGYALAAGYERLVLSALPPGWKHQPPESLSLPLNNKLVVAAASLKDVDGDGWLDAVMATGAGGLLIYGPLWEQFPRVKEADLIPAAAQELSEAPEANDADGSPDNINPSAPGSPK